jgi:hypothetical protein
MGIVGKYVIYDGEEPVGELEVAPWGAYLRFRALCRTRRSGVFRLTAECGGHSRSLGVMTPSGSGFGLERRFSPAALRSMGLERIDRCRLTRDWGEGWQEEREPERLFRDRELRAMGEGLRKAGVLSRREGDAELLAVPLEPDRPFAAMPIFCFGTPRELGGRRWLIFRILDGVPVTEPAQTGQAMDGGPNQMTGESYGESDIQRADGP